KPKGSRLRPRRNVGSTCVARMRSTENSSGRIIANKANPPRRSHRSEKLCAFQVKNPTGRTALRLSRLPSTRQNVAPVDKLGDVCAVVEDSGLVGPLCPRGPFCVLPSTMLTVWRNTGDAYVVTL